MVDQVSPALIMVDIMLPGIDGLALCRVLKSNVMTRGVPIIMVSAKGEEADIVAGLEQGAEDLHHQTVQPAGADRPAQGRVAPPWRRGA